MSDGTHPAALDQESLLAECDVTRQRRAGPGGQHRNKVETAVRLKHQPTGVVSEASERRSQAANLAMAIRRLRLNLAIEVRSPAAAEPSPLWRSRCRNGRVSISAEHADFPALLAEVLDRIADEEWNVPTAGERLGCGTSQLVKLLKMDSRALALVNRHRRALGRNPLR